MNTKEIWSYMDRLVGNHGIDEMIEDHESDVEEDTELDEVIRRETDFIEFLECACTCGIDCDMAEEEVDQVREAMLNVEKEIRKLEKDLQEKVPNLFNKKYEPTMQPVSGTVVDITKLDHVVETQPSSGAKNTSSKTKISEVEEEQEEVDKQADESLITDVHKENLLRSRGHSIAQKNHNSPS
ncbi:hypothetical protein Ciccas_007931 [Cichlidogyrus casuarinus]|uniref:Uncharacterized protein n=1 Tax=Cichlidogyrus casuarinus TaxID=1844966 RepID=A0ABD2Q1H4_9PLAT